MFLIADSTLDLLKGDHPGHRHGRDLRHAGLARLAVLAALAYSAIPAIVLGRIKKRIGAQLHDKVLHADAQMNNADWMTATAAMVGVVGIGFALRWADAVAAIVIGADILHDGVRYTRAAMQDLLDGHPRRYDEKGVHPLVDDVRRTVAEFAWARCAAVRMRELGHVFSVEVLVVPRDDAELPRCTDEAIRTITALDWKLADVVVTAVSEIEDAPPGVLLETAGARGDPISAR